MATTGTVIPEAATEGMRTARTGDQTVIFNVTGSVDSRSAEQIALAEPRRQLEATARA